MRGPFPCPLHPPAELRLPPQQEKVPDTVPQHSGEPEPSKSSCSVLSVGALACTKNILSCSKNDPSCSVHGPFPSLVLLGLVYPRFHGRMRLFGC